MDPQLYDDGFSVWEGVYCFTEFLVLPIFFHSAYCFVKIA